MPLIRRLAIALGGVALLVAAACTAEAHDRGPLDIPESTDAASGKLAIDVYGCGTCHRIPGIAGADGRVGPSLEGFGRQLYIAGAVPNDITNLVQWLRDPDSIEPGTIMPNFGLGEREASDIAAYLATLR